MTKAFPLLAILAVLPGCSLHHEPGLYPLAPPEAVAQLRRADFAPFIAARGCDLLLGIAAQAPDGNTLRWTVQAEGDDIVEFGVRVEPAPNGQTRATIEIPAVTGQGPLLAPSGAAALRQPLQAAVAELVEATLDGRAFDPARIDDDQPREQACRAVAPARPRAAHYNPWSSDPQPAFGEPAPDAGRPTMDVAPRELPSGQEDRLEDLPRPDNV